MTIEHLREELFSKRVHSDDAASVIDNDPNLRARVKFYTQAFANGKVSIADENLEELKCLVDILAFLYTNGKPLVDDTIYDILYEKLCYELTDEAITGDTEGDMSGIQLVSHRYPMMRGTLEKVYYIMGNEKRDNPSRRYLDEWILQKEKLYRERTGKAIDLNEKFVIVFGKEDGCSVIQEVDADGTERWLGRGDTKNNLAQDITHLMKGVNTPKYRQDKYKNGYCVKYELVMAESEKDRINSFFGTKFKNSRSIVAAYLHSSSAIAHIQRSLIAIPLRIISKDYVESCMASGKLPIESLIEDTQYPFMVCMLSDRKRIKQFSEQNAYYRGIRRDGAVISFIDRDICEVLGRDNDINRFEVAYKFTEESGYTFVEDVEWHVSGYGILTPVCRVQPINLKGNTISRVSLSNLGRFKELGLRIGDRVKIMYDIIPYLGLDEFCTKSAQPPLRIPWECPMCHSEVEEDGLFLKCMNDECVSKIVGRICGFLTEIGVKGIAERTVMLLRDNGIVSEIADMYRLEERKDQILGIDGIGPTKLSQMISEVNKHRHLHDYVFFGGLGVQSIGRKLFHQLFDVISYSELMDICSRCDWSSLEEMNIPNFGTSRLRAVYDWMIAHSRQLKELLKYVTISHAMNKQDRGEIVFTMYRDPELENELESLGYSIGSNVTKQTTMLACPDYALQFGKTSSKLDKARSLGIRIIGDQELRNLLQTLKR